MSAYERPTTHAEGVSPHSELIEQFEGNRIIAGEEFSTLYSDYRRDLARTAALDSKYNHQSPESNIGKASEALIFSLLSESELSEHLNFRAAHKYDDFTHGIDMIVDPKYDSLPAPATIDITVNQKDIKGLSRKNNPESEDRPVGLEKKLERARRHIDYLADFDATHARELSGWIQGGGLKENHTSAAQQGLQTVIDRCCFKESRESQQCQVGMCHDPTGAMNVPVDGAGLLETPLHVQRNCHQHTGNGEFDFNIFNEHLPFAGHGEQQIGHERNCGHQDQYTFDRCE